MMWQFYLRGQDEWWRERVQRYYFRVRLAHGPLRTIFLDGESGRWFEQSY